MEPTDNNQHDAHEIATATVPVLKERLVVDSLRTVTGRVHIQKTTDVETVEVPLPTVHRKVVERRVPVNRVVEERPEVRIEGDKTIIPVIREEAVVVKRLVLVEEIHLTNEVTKTERTEEVELATEKVTITREDI